MFDLKENEILRCPECGGMNFYVTCHVTQEWVVDEKGDFLECNDDCMEVMHYPDENDIFDCKDCGYSAEGREFVTTK